MNELLLQPTSVAKWYSMVNEAHHASPVTLAPDCERYLVYMLMRFADKPQAINSVLALDFLQAAHQVGSLREQSLRDVGDKCLLLSGLFPGRAARRSLTVAYFVDLGRTAFEAMSTRQWAAQAPCSFDALALAFVPMMDVLQTLRAFSMPDTYPLAPEQVQALWQATGSQVAYQWLQQYKQDASN